jgi:GPH family glycoside/pentoside/hexuronide:cation symporter
MSNQKKNDFWSSPLTRTKIKDSNVKMPEMLLGYFIGPFGALLSSGIFTSILQNYFTDVLKLDLTFLTTLQLLSTILIVAANLIVGQLIERTRTMAGKARPWILLSALTLSVASVLMFVVPFEGTAKMVWVAIAYNLYYAVAYPIYNTANSTLVPVSTRDSQKRGALASFTNVAGLGVMGVGSMVFPILVSFALKENQGLWFIAMLAVAIFTALTIYLQFMFTRERVTEELMENENPDGEETAKAASIKEQFRAVTSEKMWWIAILFYMVFQWSGALKNGSMSYFCKWVLDNTFFGSADAWGASQSLLSILGAIPMALAAVVVVPLANKFNKRVVVFGGMVIGVFGGVIAGFGNGNIVPVAIGVALKCLGSAPAAYLILAMLADVIDHIEFKNKIRTDGLTMSIYSSIMVAGTPIMNAIFSAVLKASGYLQGADVALGTAAQQAGTQMAIGVSYIWVETIAYAICAVLIFMFTVEKNLPEEQAAIAARKTNK